MTRAYALIETLAGNATEVRRHVVTIPGVESAEAVAGPTDVIALVRGDTIEEVNDVIDRLQGTPGVARTTTCLVLEPEGSAGGGTQSGAAA